MGSCSRQGRCERFIQEFENDYLARNTVCGYNAVVFEERLDYNDLYECVFHYMTINNGSGGEFDVMFPVPLFDPAYNVEDEIVDLAAVLDKPEEEIRARFGKADLL